MMFVSKGLRYDREAKIHQRQVTKWAEEYAVDLRTFANDSLDGSVVIGAVAMEGML